MAELNRHGGEVGDQEVGVLVSVGSSHPEVQAGAGWGAGATARSAPVSDDPPFAAAPVGWRGAAGDGLGRAVIRGAGTVATRGAVALSAGEFGAVAMGAGGRAEGSGAADTLTGSGTVTAGVAGTEAADTGTADWETWGCGTGGGAERW
jgi:hypothetical protein